MNSDPSERTKLLVRYRSQLFDLTAFASKHPGGRNTLTAALQTDIDYKFDEAVPHSDAAKYLINEYRAQGSPEANNNDQTAGTEYEKAVANNKSADGVAADANGPHILELDESMEHLVDWSRGMVSQVGALGSKYNEWVHSPVDRPLRLFDSEALEVLTKTPWWVVPCFWMPIILYIIHTGSEQSHSTSYTAFTIFMGIIMWTLLEYSLHRWVFHLDIKNQSPYLCTFHFLLHGLHHKVPFDPYRLVFPPIPATILATLIYQPVSLLHSSPLLIMAGGLLGYLVYDMIHYYIHYGSPSGGHLYYMKRYHYQHHFVHHDKGFGISSTLWDQAFGTEMILRKLRYLLKW